VFLTVGVPHSGLVEHEDTRLSAIDGPFPRPLMIPQLAVLEIVYRLSEIPNVPSLILGVPVPGVLLQHAIEPFPVTDHCRGYAHYLLRLAGNLNLNPLHSSIRLVLVDELRARLQREVLIVDWASKVSLFKREFDWPLGDRWALSDRRIGKERECAS
jgi:hypothetical protein